MKPYIRFITIKFLFRFSIGIRRLESYFKYEDRVEGLLDGNEQKVFSDIPFIEKRNY